MSTLTIAISVTEVMDDVRKKSQLECQGIESDDARYRTEAGTDKNDELARCVISSAASLAKRLKRYLVIYKALSSDDILAVPEAYTYELEFADRRLDGKAAPMAARMHDYMVHLTLAKYYATVNQGDLSKVHSLAAVDAEKDIEEMIYHKQPPTYAD